MKRFIRILILFLRKFNNKHSHKWILQRRITAIEAGRPFYVPDIEIYNCDCGSCAIVRGDFRHIQKPNAWKS